MKKGMAWAIALLALPTWSLGQKPPPEGLAVPRAAAAPNGPTEGITLDDAIRLALQHNHALQAMRTTNKLRLEGQDVLQATFEGSLVRLRPIMMTALVACLGLCSRRRSVAGGDVHGRGLGFAETLCHCDCGGVGVAIVPGANH